MWRHDFVIFRVKYEHDKDISPVVAVGCGAHQWSVLHNG